MLQMEQFSVKANESVRALLNGIGFVWKNIFIYCVFNQEICRKIANTPLLSLINMLPVELPRANARER